MKKLFFLFVFAFLISAASLKVNAVTINSCSYSTVYDLDPSASRALFRASNITNAHIQDPIVANYPYFIQCRGTNLNAPPSFSSTSVGFEGIAGWAYTQTNSHAATQSIVYTPGDGGMFLLYDTSAAKAQISCGSISGASGGDGNAECASAGWDVCVYSASGTTNAHVAACSGAGISYGTKMCCKAGAPPAASNLDYIELEPPVAGVSIGRSIPYKVIAHYNDGTQPQYVTSSSTITSSNPAIASCSSNICTGVSLGTVDIMATYLGKTANAKLRVDNILQFSYVDLVPDFVNINIGQIQAFDYIIYYNNASSPELYSKKVFSGADGGVIFSKDTSIASIVNNASSGKNQNAQGNNAGNTQIYIQSFYWTGLGGYGDESNITVLSPVPCQLLSANFTWDDTLGVNHILDGTVQASNTPVNMTLFTTSGCNGRNTNFQLYQKDCNTNTFNQIPPPNNGILIINNRSDVSINLVWMATNCPDNEAQYKFNADVIPSAIGVTNLDSGLIRVNTSIYNGGGPCTWCGSGSGCPPPRSCWGIPNGYNCISESGFCFSPAGSKCCMGIESSTIGDVKVIITREGQCVDVGRGDGTGQVKELWRRINTTNNAILESHESLKDCLLAKPANIPFFSLINFIIVAGLVSFYYVFTYKKKK